MICKDCGGKDILIKPPQCKHCKSFNIESSEGSADLSIGFSKKELSIVYDACDWLILLYVKQLLISNSEQQEELQKRIEICQRIQYVISDSNLL